MAAQLNYNYDTPKGVPGGKYDLSDDHVVTRMNEEADGIMGFGMAVVMGASKGTGVKLPSSGAVPDDFEGVTLHGANTEQDMNGKVTVRNNASLGIMKKGNVWGKTASDAVPSYGATAYVVVDGEEAGTFTSAGDAASVYKKCTSGTSGAKEVVADDTESPSGSQIKVSDVTPVADSYTPEAGDYVVSVQLHGATVDIGATFGNVSDDGIAVIVLR